MEVSINKPSSYSNVNNPVRTGIIIPTPEERDLQVVKAHLTTFDSFIKRTFDLFIIGVALIVFLIPMLLIAIAIKLTSRGPIFYGQVRVGLDSRQFTMWKFRSMKLNSEQHGAVWAIKNDPRRTKFGAFLRSSSLDELPQIWNVIKGEMSVVGPRPERPIFVEEFRKEIPHYDWRHQMKGGITGWAQVCGWRGNTSIEERVKYDLYYIKSWSLKFDIKILLLTFFRGFVNKNAY
ncbi:MAG: exopolysaccharide biosynthesis polyprenyl glycosylphosphotransferase [Deltaproteobacteria bacterium]|nr:exopolysaccharide biosynthesis polyprenyl glycosylphosphotransferase [Deltaproteobacteria bacterium]